MCTGCVSRYIFCCRSTTAASLLSAVSAWPKPERPESKLIRVFSKHSSLSGSIKKFPDFFRHLRVGDVCRYPAHLRDQGFLLGFYGPGKLALVGRFVLCRFQLEIGIFRVKVLQLCLLGFSVLLGLLGDLAVDVFTYDPARLDAPADQYQHYYHAEK